MFELKDANVTLEMVDSILSFGSYDEILLKNIFKIL
jgi:hypothetical protein